MDNITDFKKRIKQGIEQENIAILLRTRDLLSIMYIAYNDIPVWKKRYHQILIELTEAINKLFKKENNNGK